MTRLRRTLLFVPGDSQRKIEKALTLNADALIFELEDGVAYNRKIEARKNVATALTTLDFGRTERLVRINGLETELAAADIETTILGQPDGYLVPKVNSAATLQWVSQEIGRWEEAQGWNIGCIKLLAIIESALGVMNLREIATADDRLEALIFGAEDLASDIGAIRTPAGWESFYAKSAVVTAAAAFGLGAVDTPYITLKDEAGLSLEAQRSLEMGYTGKLAIHPKQVPIIQQTFTPSPDVIQTAQRLLTAYEAHEASGQGAFALDGKMVDMPMVRAARNIIEKARQIDGI